MTANRAVRPALDVLPLDVRGEEQWCKEPLAVWGAGEGPRTGASVVPTGRGNRL